MRYDRAGAFIHDNQATFADLNQAEQVLVYQHAVASGQDKKERELLRKVWQTGVMKPRDPLAWDTGKWFQSTFGPAAHPDLTPFPAGSFAIAFPFALHRPYLSRDDVGLSVIDNPVRKERVFGVPMVAPSSWKGSLRAALRTRHNWSNTHPTLDLLCGSTERQGRLHFFPTFFDRIGLEVIAPHDRERKIAKQSVSPILFECVPVGAKGRFALLYVPFDVQFDPAHPPPAEVMRDTRQHLGEVATALAALFTVYGFGAKTSSGYGRASPRLTPEGIVTVRNQAGPLAKPFHNFDELAASAAKDAEAVARS